MLYRNNRNNRNNFKHFVGYLAIGATGIGINGCQGTVQNRYLPADLRKELYQFISPNDRLHWAADKDRVDAIYWYASEENIHSRNKYGEEPLHRAVKKGNLAAVHWLLEKGAKINRQDEDGKTPFYIAVEEGNRVMAQLLFDRGADPTLPSRHVGTPFVKAIWKGDVEMILFLMDKGVSINREDLKACLTPLSGTAGIDNRSLLQLLFKRGVKLNTADSSHLLVSAISATNYYKSIVELLLKKGADPRLADEHGDTALHVAARCRRVDAARRLLSCDGVEINQRNQRGETPLCVAVSSDYFPSPIGMVQFLLEQGADANIANNRGQKPLQIARKFSDLDIRDNKYNKDIVSLLEAHTQD